MFDDFLLVEVAFPYQYYHFHQLEQIFLRSDAQQKVVVENLIAYWVVLLSIEELGHHFSMAEQVLLEEVSSFLLEQLWPYQKDS